MTSRRCTRRRPSRVPGVIMPGERPTLGRLDRKVDRHAPNVRRHSVVSQGRPEGLAGAVRTAGIAEGQRNRIGTERQDRGFVPLADRRGRRSACIRIAVDEVEDAVAAGIPAGAEVRPSHGALGRRRRAERMDATALLDQALQVGNLVGVELDHILARMSGSMPSMPSTTTRGYFAGRRRGMRAIPRRLHQRAGSPRVRLLNRRRGKRGDEKAAEDAERRIDRPTGHSHEAAFSAFGGFAA